MTGEKKLSKGVIFYLFLGMGMTCSQVQASEAPLPLEALLKKIWQTSPQLAAQRDQLDLAQGDRARRLLFNEPQLQYINSDSGTASAYGVSLVTGFPGKSLFLMQADSARARSASAELQARKYELTRTVIQGDLDCATARATYELQKTTSADLETVFHSLKALYETGHSTQAEKIGSELLSRQAHLDLLNAEDRQNVQCRKFARLLSDVSAGEVAGDAILPEDLDPALIAELGGSTADQSRSGAALDTADAADSTAFWSQLPDLTLSLNRNHYAYLPGSPSGAEWTTTYGVSVTFPIFFPFRESAEIRRARSQAALDRDSARLLKANADADLEDASREYRRSRTRLAELRSMDLALAEALVDSTYSAYRAGKLGYAELVLSRKTLTDLRAQEIQLRASVVNSHLRCLSHCEENL